MEKQIPGQKFTEAMILPYSNTCMKYSPSRAKRALKHI